jgi:hypothetical protein
MAHTKGKNTMTQETIDFIRMSARLDCLEKQNRKMKKTLVTGFAFVGCVLLMAQSRPNGTIEAERFVVKDKNGKEKAALGMATSESGGASLTIGSPEFANSTEKYIVTIHGGDYAWLNLRSRDGKETINADINSKDGPELLLSDKEGYKTDIGHTDLITSRTGETHYTSAASVVLFGKDKHVLWSAP